MSPLRRVGEILDELVLELAEGDELTLMRARRAWREQQAQALEERNPVARGPIRGTAVPG